jgi:predicted transcriptional regulator
MSTPLITIDPTTDLTEAAEVMKTHNIHKLLVARNDIIYGILTEKIITQRFQGYVNRSVKDVFRWSVQTIWRGRSLSSWLPRARSVIGGRL